LSVVNERQVAVLEEAEHLAATAKNIGRLGDKYSPEYSRWAFVQWELRRKAKEKFSRAAKLIFTRSGLEMATHSRIAAYHASLFPVGAEVLDATCGIGSDLIALAARGPVVGVDIDREHVECARHNLKVYGFKGKVSKADAMEVLANGWEYVFCDPARRGEVGRFLNPEDFQPRLDLVMELTESCKLACIKLSPMMRDEYLRKLGGHVQFLSFGGECREALLVFPGEVTYSAVHIESGERVAESPLRGRADSPKRLIFEADPAMIRAHALGSLEIDGLGDSNGYLTGFVNVESPWLRQYEVLWHGSWRAKTVKDVLRAEGWRVDAVKKRGVQLEPTSVIRQVEVDGGSPVQMMLYPVGDKVCAALVRRLS
jgi:SAM-dependent methyltransferase